MGIDEHKLELYNLGKFQALFSSSHFEITKPETLVRIKKQIL
jgi:hypothetical protein